MMYMVTDLQKGDSFYFDSISDLVNKFKCVTEKRVMLCIETGQKWKGLVFDVVES